MIGEPVDTKLPMPAPEPKIESKSPDLPYGKDPRDNLSRKERRRLKAFANQTAAQVKDVEKLFKELARHGWVSGTSYDYMVTQVGRVFIRTKQGKLVDDYLPQGWRFSFSQGLTLGAHAFTKSISIDPRTDAGPLGMTGVIHEIGHALQREADPEKAKRQDNDSMILGKKIWSYLLVRLRELPDDKARALALGKAFNTLLKTEAEGSDFGLPVAEALDMDREEYLKGALNDSLSFYWHHYLPVIAQAIKETTALQESDLFGDIYMFNPSAGIANKKAEDALIIQHDVTVGQVFKLVEEIEKPAV